MFGRLMHLTDRIGRKVDEWNEAAWMLVGAVRLHLRRHVQPPAFPYRCQHCSQAIRLASASHPALRGASPRPRVFYIDAGGAYYCSPGLSHHPMPNIR